MARRPPTPLIASALVLSGLLLAGCRIHYTVRKTETGTPRYDRIHVVYEMNGRYRDLPLHDNRAQPVSFQADAATPAPIRWKGARLSIAYPHPEGAHSMARATLRLSGTPADSPEAEKPSETKPTWMEKLHDPAELFAAKEDPVADPIAALHSDEIWVLDFPKSELDLLLADLSHSGFFETQVRPTPGTNLDVQIDWGRTTKTWTPEPRLDDFVNRVYGQGRLSGFVAGDAKDDTPSTLAYFVPHRGRDGKKLAAAGPQETTRLASSATVIEPDSKKVSGPRRWFSKRSTDRAAKD